MLHTNEIPVHDSDLIEERDDSNFEIIYTFPPLPLFMTFPPPHPPLEDKGEATINNPYIKVKGSVSV